MIKHTCRLIRHCAKGWRDRCKKEKGYCYHNKENVECPYFDEKEWRIA